MKIKPLYIALGLTGVAILLAKRSNAALFNLITGFEGLRLQAYPDAGKWAIGYGSQYNHAKGRPVREGDKISAAQAVQFFNLDTAGATAAIQDLVKVPLSVNQRNALTSLVYNIGRGNFASSTLLKRLNAGDYKGAANQFSVWVYSQGNVVQDLIQRRAKEKALFLS